MDELRRRFAAIDRIAAPDLWTEIERRADVLGAAESGSRRRACPALMAHRAGHRTRAGPGRTAPDRRADPRGSPDRGPRRCPHRRDRFGPTSSVPWSSRRWPSEPRRRRPATVQAPGAGAAVSGCDRTDAGSPPISRRRRSCATAPRSSPVAGTMPTTDSHSLATAQTFDAQAGSWTAITNMGSGRSVHTATRLADGRVLVAGGFDDWAALATAEIYDPATGSWTPTGSMIEGRGYHTATLLPDGRVLVAGGRSNNSSTGHALSSAELYDPTTGTWTQTASMSRGRTFHTATLLRDGRVLVAGAGILGVRVDVADTAEIYDPAAGTWTPTGSMTAPRAGHNAVLLPTGEVLVAGGNDSTSRCVPGGERSRRWRPPSSTTRRLEPGYLPVTCAGPTLCRPRRSCPTARCSSPAAAWAGTARCPGRARTTSATGRPSQSCTTRRPERGPRRRGSTSAESCRSPWRCPTAESWSRAGRPPARRLARRRSTAQSADR